MSELVDVHVEAVRVHMDSGQHMLVLVETGGERVLPIWVGQTEATGVSMRLQGTEPARPMSWDLTTATLERFGLAVRRVVITRREAEVFYAELHVGAGEREEVLDARPSDAVNVAVRTGAPITVARDLFEKESVTPEASTEPRPSALSMFWATLADESDQHIGMVQLVGPVEPGTLVRLARPGGGELTWEISPPETGSVPPKGEARLVR